MFYVMVQKMAFEMGVVMLVIWIAMMVLERRQVVFRWAVIGGMLLFGVASYFGMQALAIGFQLTSLFLLLFGWACKTHWQIKHARSQKEN